jgi:hypothetical protein
VRRLFALSACASVPYAHMRRGRLLCMHACADGRALLLLTRQLELEQLLATVVTAAIRPIG